MIDIFKLARYVMNKITSKWSFILGQNSIRKEIPDNEFENVSEQWINEYKKERKQHYQQYIKHKLGKAKRK